jgi:hypothetical protein
LAAHGLKAAHPRGPGQLGPGSAQAFVAETIEQADVEMLYLHSD